MGPQPASATTISRRIAASASRCIACTTHTRLIGLLQVTDFALSIGEKGQAPYSGGLGERGESVLKPALRPLHDVGDDR